MSTYFFKKGLYIVFLVSSSHLLIAQSVKTREVLLPIRATDPGHGSGRYTLTLKANRKWMQREHIPLRMEPRRKGPVGTVKYSDEFIQKFNNVLREFSKETDDPFFDRLRQMQFDEEQAYNGDDAMGNELEEVEVPDYITDPEEIQKFIKFKNKLKAFEAMNRKAVKEGKFHTRKYLHEAFGIAAENTSMLKNLPAAIIDKLEKRFGGLSTKGVSTYKNMVTKFAGDNLTSKMKTKWFEGGFRIFEVITADDPFAVETYAEINEFGKDMVKDKIDDLTLGKIPEKLKSPALVSDAFLFLAKENGISMGELLMGDENGTSPAAEGFATLFQETGLPPGIQSEGMLDDLLWHTPVCDLPRAFYSYGFDFYAAQQKLQAVTGNSFVEGEKAGRRNAANTIHVFITRDFEGKFAPSEMIGGNIHFDRVDVVCKIGREDARYLRFAWDLSENITIVSSTPYISCSIVPTHYDLKGEHNLQVFEASTITNPDGADITEEISPTPTSGKGLKVRWGFRQFDLKKLADREFGLLMVLKDAGMKPGAKVSAMGDDFSELWNPMRLQVTDPTAVSKVNSVFEVGFDIVDIETEKSIEIGKPSAEPFIPYQHPVVLRTDGALNYKMAVYDPRPIIVDNPKEETTIKRNPQIAYTIASETLPDNTLVRCCQLWEYINKEAATPYTTFHFWLNAEVKSAIKKGNGFRCDKICIADGYLESDKPRSFNNITRRTDHYYRY